MGVFSLDLSIVWIKKIYTVRRLAELRSTLFYINGKRTTWFMVQ
jgi:hypothetical protein